MYLVIAFVIFDLIFLVFVFSKRKRGGISFKEKEKLIIFWDGIVEDGDYNHAVMNADKMLDRLLALKGYSGSLGEKLKKSGNLFSDLDGFWSVHKLRNRIAHEMGVKISQREAKNALQKYERAFRDLGLF